MHLKEKTIGVFFGGKSPEHEISVITGEFVIAELKKLGYTAVAVYVDRDGIWRTSDSLGELQFFEGDFSSQLKKMPTCNLSLEKSQSKLVIEYKSGLSKKEVIVDFLFPTFHGMGGEDGSIQGLAEFFGVPYAGCGIYTSSVAIDKALTKDFFHALELPTTTNTVITSDQWQSNQESCASKVKELLTYPLFVKPTRAGSSIGITKVKEEKDLADAIDLALYYDNTAIIEEAVENICDLTCAVLSDGEELIASAVQESLFESDLFDYSVKYLEDGGAQTGNAASHLVIPASITDEQKQTVQDMSKAIFANLHANGTLRVDFLLNRETGELYANEINTLPGTLYHHLWEKTDIPIGDVIEKMLAHGMKRHDEHTRLHTDYATTVLQNANSLKLQNK